MAQNHHPTDGTRPDTGPVDSAETTDPATLRELLLASERRRARAEASRQQVEAVLAGLDLLSSAVNVDDLFRGILRIIHESVPYAAAAVLVEDSQTLVVASTTDDDVAFGALTVDPFLDRVLGGRPAVVTDLRLVAGLEPLVASSPYLRSGVFMPLPSKDQRALFCCLGNEVGQYATAHRDILRHLAPLSGQALQRYRDAKRVDNLVRELDHMAHTDALTGLANRSRFTSELDRHLDRFRTSAVPFAIVMVDIDNLKVVNDTVGHEGGDRLIRAVGRGLRRAGRPTDTVARLGGDEFALIVGSATAATVGDVAQRALREVSHPIEVAGDEIVPRVSIGTSVCPLHGSEPDETPACADIALYEAKAAGGDRIVAFSPEMGRSRAEEQELEHGLRAALADRQLTVHYQPIVRLADGQVAGYEAMIRWVHPERGVLDPASFLAGPARPSLTCRLDRWVLQEAAGELSSWLAGDADRRLTVNLRAVGPSVVSQLAEIVTRWRDVGIESTQLELELDPGLVLDRAADAIDQLQALDLGIAFDRFGSGRWRVDELRRPGGRRVKIDRHFVTRALLDDVDLVVVERAVDLAHAAGLAAVAVGVETSEQLDAMRRVGCDEAQGPSLGGPAPWPSDRRATSRRADVTS